MNWPTFPKLKLRLLLGVTPVLIERAASRSRRLRDLLDAEPFVMQVMTSTGGGGYFQLRGGRLRFHGGAHAAPDFTQVWTTAADAVQALTSRDETDVLRAFEAGRLRMKGEFAVALWFNEAMKIARHRTSGQVTAFLAQGQG